MSAAEVYACLLAALASYVLGATPFGYLAGRMKGIDIRGHGSGNIGATNVWRVLGKRVGLPVFVLDVVKGWLPVWLTMWVCEQRGLPSGWPAIAAAVGTVLGHNFTFWLGFKGGKGIATSAGVLLALLPLPLACGLGMWALLFFTLRYVGLASIGAATAVAVSAVVLHFTRGNPSAPLAGFACFIGVLAVWRHRANIRRMLNGTEPKFSRKSKSTPAA
jgi:acyl phosphate:glycerol-3-phosphate acyltransferase